MGIETAHCIQLSFSDVLSFSVDIKHAKSSQGLNSLSDSIATNFSVLSCDLERF